jgi:hypothetical protein
MFVPLKERNSETLTLNSYKMKPNLIQKLESNLEKCEYQLKMSKDVMMSHNSVCVFPVSLLTIEGKGGKEGLNITSKVIASQYTPEDAKAICKAVTNGAGQSPVIMSPVQYYSEMIESIKDTISLLQD